MFTTAPPEEAGISSAGIREFVVRLNRKDIPMHGILLLKDDKLVYEAYQKPFTRDSLHRMFSITKSMVALAIGLLMQEGRIRLEDHIADYFPEKLPRNVHPYIRAITIKDMLMMRTAHHKTTYKLEGCTDWVKSFFEVQPSHYPGTFFAYDTSSAHVMAALVEKLTGKELLVYLRERCLDAIGFSKEAYCLKDPMGVSMGGSGLMATPMDIMRVMYLVMKGGHLDGKQYLPKDYIETAVSRLSDNYAASSGFEEMQGYGYQFWRTTHNGYVCYGMGGQLGLCLPDHNMILVTTADTQGRQGGVQLIYDTFWDTVYKDCEENKDGRKAADGVSGPLGLPEEIPQVCLENMAGNAGGSCRDRINGKKIIADKNEKGFVSFTLNLSESDGELVYENSTGIHSLRFGIGCNKATEFPYYGHRALVSGAWRSANTFLICAQIIDEYVGKVFLSFSFNGDHAGILLKKIEETYYKEFDLVTSGTVQRD